MLQDYTSVVPETVQTLPDRQRRAPAHKVRRNSKPVAFESMDRRTKEYRFLKETENALLAHVGKAPTAVVKQLCARLARLTLYVNLFDARAMANGGQLSDHDTRQFLAYQNSLERGLHRLGVQPGAAPVVTLADLLDDLADEADEPEPAAPRRPRGRPRKDAAP